MKLQKKEWALAFLTAFLGGMLTHLYMFTNNLLTWDGVLNSHTPQELTSSARPFLVYFTGISSDYNLPMVIGTLSVFFLSMTAVALTECFQMKNPWVIMLTALFVVTFPAVAGTFCYLYTADGYMAAYLFSVLAFLLAKRCAVGYADNRRGRFVDCRKWGWLFGGILLAVSLGIYQAYLGVTVTLCMLDLLLSLIETDWKEIGRRTGRYALMGISGYLEYLIAVRVMSAVKHIPLSGYSGTDRMTGMVLSDIPRGIVQAYRNFISFLVNGNVLTANIWMRIAMAVLVIFCIAVYGYALFRGKRERGLVRILCAALLTALLPLGATLYCVIYPDTFVYILLRMCWVLYFIFALALAERYVEREYIQRGCLAASAVMVFQFYLLSNITYYNMNEKYEKSYALAIRVADRIEQQEEYHPWIKAVFLGEDPDYNKYPTTESTREDLSGIYPAKGDFFLNNEEKFKEFLSDYLCISLADADEEELKKLNKNPIVQQMGTFPAADSVQVVDGILVVKIGE